MHQSLEDALMDIFGPKYKEFGEDLLDRLRQLHKEGIKSGLLMEREKAPIPEELFNLWERPPGNPPDVPEDNFKGKYANIEKDKAALIEKLETLTCEVELRIQPEKTLGTRGIELKIRTQIKQINRAVGKILNMVLRL